MLWLDSQHDDNQPPVALDDVFYIGAASSVSFNVLENDADYECTDNGRYTIKLFCDMYVVNFTQPRHGTVKFPYAKPIFPSNSRDPFTAAAAAAPAHPAVSFGEVDDWRVNGQLQYTLDPSVTRPVTDQFTYTVADARRSPVTNDDQIRYSTATVTVVAEYSSMASTIKSHFSLPDAQGRRSVVFTLPPNPVDRLGGALRLLALDDSGKRGKLELLRSTPGLRVFNYTAASAPTIYTAVVKYRAVASDGQVERGIVFLDVTGRPGRNTPPIAADVHLDLHISPLSSSFSGLMLDVLGSCYDADAYDKRKLSIAQVERPDRGTAEVIDGMLRYNTSSEAGEFEDKFAYFVQDTKGAVAEDWVYITATSYYRTNNAPPFAIDDFYTVAAGASVTMDLLSNDFDPDGDDLMLTVHTLPRFGTLVRTSPGGGVLVYTPSAGVGSVTDSFRYYVSDGTGTAEEAPATVTISITGGRPPNRHPVVSDIVSNITSSNENPGYPGTFSISIDLLQAATDPDGDVLHIAETQYGSGGTDDYEYSIEPLVIQTSPVEIRGNSVYKFTLKFWREVQPGTCPPVISLSYYVTDGQTTTEAWVHVVPMMNAYVPCGDTASKYPRAPVLNSASIPTFDVTYGKAVFINFTQFGYHPNGRNLSSTIVDFPAHGTVKLQWLRLLRGYNNIDTDDFLVGVHYKPTGGHIGADSLTFRLLDVRNQWASVEPGTVRIIVEPAEEPCGTWEACRVYGLCGRMKCKGPGWLSGGCPFPVVVGSNTCGCDAAQGFRPGPIVDPSTVNFYQPIQHCAWNLMLPEMLVANVADVGRIVRVPFQIMVGSTGKTMCVAKPIVQMIRVDNARMVICPAGVSSRVLMVNPNAAVRAGSEACSAGLNMAYNWLMLPEKPAREAGCYKATVLTTDRQKHRLVLHLR